MCSDLPTNLSQNIFANTFSFLNDTCLQNEQLKMDL